MLGIVRGRWTQGMKGEAVWALAGDEEGAKGLPGALLSTQKPPPAPSPVHHVPVLAVSPLSPTWSGLSSAKERWRGWGKGLGRGSLPAQQRRAGLGPCFGWGSSSHSKGKAGKSLQGRAGPCPPWDWAHGDPSGPRTHSKSRAAVSVPVTHLEEAPAPAAGAGREGDDGTHHLPSHSFPGLRGKGDQHKPQQPPPARKGGESSRRFGHQHFQAGMRQPLAS